MNLDSPHSVHVEPHPHSASVTQVESSKLLPWLMLCALLSGAALMGSVTAIIWASMSARETKQLQIQVMDMNALGIRNGWIHPGDEVYGPAGNLEYRPKPEKRTEPHALDSGTAESRN